MLTSDPYERLLHTYGKSYPETVRAFARDFANAPDLVALPARPRRTSPPCSTGRAARRSPSFRSAAAPRSSAASSRRSAGPIRGAVSLDLRRLDRVLEVDATSRAARIQGGIRGPAIEAALKPHGLAIRHYPQSFEFSTLGGWIATRSGGHFATLYTHIDDFVESLRTITPAGAMESRRLPGSGAGPQPGPHDDRLRGRARRDHRGLDAAAGPAALPRRRRVRLPRFLRRREGRARGRASRALSLEPARHRQRRGRHLWRQRLRGEPARPRLRVRRPSGRRLDGARGRTPAGPRRPPPYRRGRGASAGARPSSACPMRAN